MNLPPCAARCAFWIALFFCSGVRAETLELVTYYPTASNTGDLDARSLTVGTAYNPLTPDDGGALLSSGVFVRGGNGQVTGSGGLVMGDAFAIEAYLDPAGSFMLTPEQYARADVNGDGQVTQLDRFLILNMLSFAMDLNTARTAGKRLADRALAIDLAGNIGLGTGQPVGIDSLAAVGTNRVLIDNTGRVGIGTGAPQSALHLIGQMRIEDLSLPQVIFRQEGAAAGSKQWKLYAGGGSFWGTLTDDMDLMGTPWLQVSRAGTSVVSVAFPNGRIDLGTPPLQGTAASNLLRTNAGVLGPFSSNALSLASFGFRTDSSPMSNNVSLGVRAVRMSPGTDWNTTAIGLGIDVDNSVQVGGTLWLAINGSVGIGTTTPGYALEVINSIYARRQADGLMTRLGLQNTNRHWSISNYGTEIIPNGAFVIADETVPATRLTITAAGNVGIGTNTPAEALHVIGHAGKTVGGAVWADLSDGRLKKNIQPIEGALDRMLQLRGVTFEWKDPVKVGDRPGQHMGMIAQEVERVFPEWVSRDADGMRMVGAEGLLPLMIESFRELQQQNDRLREQMIERLEAQEKELQALKRQVEGTRRRP